MGTCLGTYSLFGGLILKFTYQIQWSPVNVTTSGPAQNGHKKWVVIGINRGHFCSKARFRTEKWSY